MDNFFKDFPLFPEQASTNARRVDSVFLGTLLVVCFFTFLIMTLIVFFSIKYRKRPGNLVSSAPASSSLLIEIAWTVIPALISIVLFVRAARVYFDMSRPPLNSMEIYVVGKQWMWKLQHPDGRREINDLHIPIGVPVKLVMTSEDVIHSFYVPAFRTKQDVLPGRYTTEWFQATKPGIYPFFCAEFCGTQHSAMNGHVIVMAPPAFAKWMSGGTMGDEAGSSRGEQVFAKFRCATCHDPSMGHRAPDLAGLYGSQVTLKNGRRLKADETYIRESIFVPNAKVVNGFDSIMPSYKGQVTEDDVVDLIGYIKSLDHKKKQTAGGV